MGTIESLVVGYIVGLVVGIVAFLFAIAVFITGGNGELGDFMQGLFDFVLSYFNPHPNSFLIGFFLGISTTVGGGASASRS